MQQLFRKIIFLTTCIIIGNAVQCGEDLKDKFPWMSSLMERKRYKCGAVLINECTLLTAAQCFISNMQTNVYTAFIGIPDLWQIGPDTKFYQITKMKMHENFTRLPGGAFKNDLALLQLDHSVPKASIIKLAEKEPTIDQLCTIAGWGYIDDEDVRTPHMLQVAKVPICDLSKCNSTDHYKNALTEGMVCAGWHASGRKKNDLKRKYCQDACGLDLGGPLQCKSKDKSDGWSLYGIISFGHLQSAHHNCNPSLSLGIYADVYHAREWILKNQFHSCYGKQNEL